MKKLFLTDDSFYLGDIGYDHESGWSIPRNVRKVEFEDGTILINENFDPNWEYPT